MHSINLEIEPTGHFFKIHLFDTANEMREYYDEFCRKTGQEAGPMDFSAITMPYLYTLTQMVADLVRHFHEINAFE